jgi:RNA polymerase sigma-70 factor (ECF subfamily)
MTGQELSTDLERERALVRAARRGDDDAWRSLFDDYYPRLQAYMRARVQDHALAEDLAAEVFVDAFRGLPRFQWRGKPFGAWLFRVARNRVRMHFRTEARRPDAVSDVPPSLPGDSPEPDLALVIEQTLAELSPDHREAIELRYVIGLSGQEAAAAMGRSHGSFRMLLHRAVQAFKREYGDLP